MIITIRKLSCPSKVPHSVFIKSFQLQLSWNSQTNHKKIVVKMFVIHSTFTNNRNFQSNNGKLGHSHAELFHTVRFVLCCCIALFTDELKCKGCSSLSLFFLEIKAGMKAAFYFVHSPFHSENQQWNQQRAHKKFKKKTSKLW